MKLFVTLMLRQKKLIELTLAEFIENQRRRDVRELRNKIKLDPDYDYKK